MTGFEVISSAVMRHRQCDAVRILTLNLATCITTNLRQDEPAALARLAASIRTLSTTLRDLIKVKEDQGTVRELLKRGTQKLNWPPRECEMADSRVGPRFVTRRVKSIVLA